MLILSLGVPRSGTILVFNIIREILTRRDIPFRAVNTNYPETTQFLSRHDFRGNVVMHAHNVLPAVQEALRRDDTTAFFNYRDPRDVLVSMMRLHDYSFEKCLELVEISFQHFLKAREFPQIDFIAYDALIADTPAHIRRIGGILDAPPGEDDVTAVHEATSLDAHRRIMHDVAQGRVEVQTRGNPKRVLRESTTHFINDRHIQSGRSGRWRDEMTAEQQAVATAQFRDLLRVLAYPQS